jgi:hypothetical protein
MKDEDELAQGVVRVGDGRGFIVEAKHSRVVITAAHCLPHFPPPAASVGYDERTYGNLLGPMDGSPSVWCELMFADPIAEIAVLGAPDGQELYAEHEIYLALTEDHPAFRVADPQSQLVDARLLSLDGEWQDCKVRHVGNDHPVASATPLWIERASGGIRGGMSGSPVVAGDAAIGVVCVSGGKVDAVHTAGGSNPRLTHTLPGWLLNLLRDVEPKE